LEVVVNICKWNIFAESKEEANQMEKELDNTSYRLYIAETLQK